MAQNKLNKLNGQLIKAAEHGDTEKVRELLDAGADINSADQWRDTVLMRAAAYGYANTVKMLLDAGADIDIQDKFGRTALMLTAAWGRTGIMELLIQAGADISIRDNDGKTAFDMLKEDHPEQYDQWIRDTAVKHRKTNLKREDFAYVSECVPDFNI